MSDAAGARARPSLRALTPLLPYAVRYKGRIAAAVAALVVASAATLVVPLAIRRMIDLGFGAEDAAFINTYFVALVGVVGVLALASGTRYYFVVALGERVVADLRIDLFRHLSTLDPSFYDTARTGELVSRLTADTTQMKSAFGASASIALRNVFLFVGAIALMVTTSPKLSILVLVAIPLIVLPLVASGRHVRERSRRAQDRLAEATSFATENLGAVRTMQAYTAEAVTNRRFASAAEGAYAAARDATGARAILTTVAIFLAFGSVVGVLWLGAHDVLAGRISGGLLSQFVIYAVLGASALGELSQVWGEVSAAAGAAGRIGELLAVTPRIRPPVAPVADLPARAQGRLAFEDVTFAYPSRPGDAAVRGLSFTVEPGETVAIVGPSGAGKSTVLQLVLRFYDPDVGVVRLDGVDVRALDPARLRAQVALVPQDPVVFGASIADNIRYGREEASDAEVADAGRRAAADVFVRELPDGYATLAGERGVTLSGGQRQRLAIARAILRDAPVLLLDEATSALDSENETLVQAALDSLRGRTTIVIAHRLATVTRADRILVMDGGRIVEEGTHATLVARDGLYARLARLQFQPGDGLPRAAE